MPQPLICTAARVGSTNAGPPVPVNGILRLIRAPTVAGIGCLRPGLGRKLITSPSTTSPLISHAPSIPRIDMCVPPKAAWLVGLATCLPRAASQPRAGHHSSETGVAMLMPVRGRGAARRLRCRRRAMSSRSATSGSGYRRGDGARLHRVETILHFLALSARTTPGRSRSRGGTGTAATR